jgi:hypothetical protein
MDETCLRQQLQIRNDRETEPFQAIHQAYHHLLLQVDTLQAKLDASVQLVSVSRQQLEDASTASAATTGATTGSKGHGNASTYAAALKNEARVRDKLEKVSPQHAPLNSTVDPL